MNLKGISPIIAAVLLIAVTITIGIMVTTWSTDWVNEQTRKDDMTCAVDTNYIIEKAEYNRTFNSSLLIKIQNKGKVRIYGFGVDMDNGTDIISLNSTNSLISQGGISKTNPLGRERTVYLVVNLTNSIGGYLAFGNSLLTSEDIEIRVNNQACNSVSAKTDALS